ncbi:tetratricopeptide repeat domain 21B [Culex quinquefasciatus]|uniref:Tetratricopeptide repeat domain 21B n=4 Tax=Culex pipiens complex TaxID=518105 RepID=B0WWU5_CULQU|nr:tetratricopeptide repeat domain 21B [Culex quinquefasciatus]|eukprot:XP_001861867.1 tetratricopeptide repeat domain 21B [Culex quinquefasciatus]
MDEQDYKSIIIYYGREKLYRTMHRVVLEAMAKYTADTSFRYYNGMALVLEGVRLQEGIRELNQLQGDREFGMAVILSLMYAHKRCSVIDKEEIVQLDGKLKDERKRLTATSAYYSALFLFLTGKIDKAREYADKAMRLSPSSPEVLSLKGWCELYLNKHRSSFILDLFEKALEQGKQFDANIGQVRYHQLNNDYETAISVLNRLSVRYPELNIPLVEKMKCNLSNWNWDNAVETATRILNLEPTNLEALQLKILILIAKDGNFTGSVSALQYLFKAMEKIEPANGDLFMRTGQLFSRICGRNPAILAEAYLFAEKAHKLNPSNAEFLTELGYQTALQKKYKEATKLFKTASKIDDSSMYALCGLTLCQMMESGVSEQVSQQIEFLTEIQGDEKIPILLLMSSILYQTDHDKAVALLIEASEIQFKNLKTLSYGAEYLRQLNPDFLLELVKELLKHSPAEHNADIISVDALHPTLRQCSNILDSVVKACPGLVEASFLLAKVQFLSSEVGAAATTLQKILHDIDPTYSDAHLLIAQIHIQQKSYQRAAQSLEICLSHDFKVRENPMYHLLQGIVYKNQQRYEDGLKSFFTAMNICGLSSTGSANRSPSAKKMADRTTLGTADLLTLYLEIINTHVLMNQNSEALKLMQMVSSEFTSTTEEGRLTIATADFYMQQGNFNKAVELLKNIRPNQPYYVQAKTKMAQFYLVHKKDRLTYAQCFRELVANCPGPSSYLMLGDAYMSIQEPDDAIEAYKQAHKQNPRDSLLASKLGRAYVKTHQYKKAIAYYQEAIASPENYLLKLDLAELFLKLKQYSNAEQTLVDEIELSKGESGDISKLQTRTKQLLLLARIREKAGYLSSSLNTLKEARDNQYKIQKRMLVDQNSVLSEQNNMLARICVLMAEQSIAIRDNEQAIHHYKEALKITPNEIGLLAALARTYMQVNNMDQCQATCATILQNDPNNEAASVMMADLSFRRMDFENAAYHFSQLLISQPTYWTALARLIEVMRRSGTLHDVQPFLNRAEDECLRPDNEAGLNYCKGLQEWYNGNPNSALRFFNNCRRDPEWGQQAIYNMIEICLNPDGDLPNEGVIDIGADDLEIKDSRAMALRTAERLLKELKPRPGVIDNEALNHRLLENFHLLASRQKHSIDRALQDFTAIASQEEYKEHVGAVYGMASAYVILKQSQRAKNQLKRIAKNNWTFEEADYLEKSWLLLADLYMQASKFDMATDLLKRVLEHNKSCTKAYELCGLVSEKEQNYRNAAINYDLAWKCSAKSKPNVGYKLAFNYMKIKRYADAIDICQQVLKIHPDYPSIKKDILDKCRNNLKN